MEQIPEELCTQIAGSAASTATEPAIKIKGKLLEINMNIFLIYAFLFFIGSLFGWGLELVFRHWFSRANPEHRWINPGFCVGPYVPLYGFGLCILYFMANMIERMDINGIAQHALALILIAAELTLLEYAAGLFLLRAANVRLWDYSMMWGNVNGLICPLFTLFWTLLGVMY